MLTAVENGGAGSFPAANLPGRSRGVRHVCGDIVNV